MTKPKELADWILQVAHTSHDEIQCDEFAELMPGFVEAELGGLRPELTAPQFTHHLQTCNVCREEYETLRAFLLLGPRDLATHC